MRWFFYCDSSFSNSTQHLLRRTLIRSVILLSFFCSGRRASYPHHHWCFPLLTIHQRRNKANHIKSQTSVLYSRKT